MPQTSRQRHRLLSATQKHLAGAAELPQLGKHRLEGVLDVLIGICFETPVTQVDVANGHMGIVFAAPRLLAGWLLGTVDERWRVPFRSSCPSTAAGRSDVSQLRRQRG